MVSSIPVGSYTCKRIHSPKFGNVFEVMNVPGRTHILIHAANIADELHGCIALGLDVGVVYNKWAVVNSKDALKQFMDFFKDVDSFELEISNA